VERINYDGWKYKTNQAFYKTRDSALIAVLYVCALRISEALRLTRDQFRVEEKRIVIEGIRLSKVRRKNQLRQSQFREYAFIPLEGDRGELGQKVQVYLALLSEKERLFPFRNVRAYQIVSATLGIPCHWLRAFGENFLYDVWEHDLLAVADYVKVDPQTLSKYIRRSYTKYKEK
jgi:integrase